MKIKNRLFLLVSGVILGSLVVLMAALFIFQRGYLLWQFEQRVDFLSQLIERSTREAFISGDRLTLVSQLQFLKTQHPELYSAEIDWKERGRLQELRIKPENPGVSSLESRQLVVTDPELPQTQVSIKFTVDRKLLQNEFIKSTPPLFRRIFYILLVLFGFGALASLFVSRSFTRPIEALARGAQEIGQGQTGIKLQYARRDEFGGLIHSFNQMSERLSELDQMKKDLMASVSHEFKSPISAIDSIIDVMRSELQTGQTMPPEDLSEFLLQIQTNMQRLDRLVRDVLDASKIEKGLLTCRLRRIPIGFTIKSAIELYETKARDQKVDILYMMDPDCPLVHADPDRILQVLLNLLSNALKFTPAGGNVIINAEPVDSSRRQVRISVRDTGVGMNEKDIANLFQKFQQGSNVDQRNPNHAHGTGLGLFISKSIIEQHGGHISVKSTSGLGSIFAFTLRAA